jgi:hypothetical protein
MSVMVDRRPDGATVGSAGRVVARALAAALVLVGIVVGVPILLLRLGVALPIDTAALAPGALGRPDDGALLLSLLLGLAWLTWALTVASLTIELVATLRRTPTPRLPGMAVPQRLAAALIGALVLVGSMGTAPPASARPAPLATAVALVVESVPLGQPEIVATATGTIDRDGHAAAVGGDGQGSSLRQASASLPMITTQRHDTLWLLAEQHLGSGERFTEFIALNKGVEQADGRALGDDGRVYPGWRLRLPADAVVAAERVERHLVESGDTLWDIAAEELGDPLRHPEIFVVNQGDRQPDGGTLEDPDLIRTGWVLELPGRGTPAGAGAGPAAGATGDAATDDSVTEDAAAGDAATEDAAAGDGFTDDGATEDAAAGDAATEDAAGLVDPGLDPDAVDDSSVPRLDRGAVSTDPEGPASMSGRGVPPLDRGMGAGPAPTTPAEPTPADGDGAGWGDGSESGIPDASPAPRALESPVPMGAIIDEGPAALTGSGDPAISGDERPSAGAVVPLPVGGALTVLLLAGIAGEVARRRRQFQRHRRPGERMPALTAGQRSLEAAARDAVAEVPTARWESALREVVRQARATGQGQPRVRVVRAGSDVHLHLAESAVPVRPFVAGGDRHWILDPDWPGGGQADGCHDVDGLDGAGGPDDPADPGVPYPALVAVGVAGDATVLVNLEEVGTLRVAGTPALRPDVLRALATEATLGRARALVARTLVVADDSIARAVEAGDLVVERDVDRVTVAIDAVMAARRSADTRAPEVAGEAALSDPIEIVVADRSLPIEVTGGSGAALVTSAQASRPGAILALDAGGSAVLLPEAIGLVPQSLPEPSLADLVGLLCAADVPEDPAEDSPGAVAGSHSCAPAGVPRPTPDLEPAGAGQAVVEKAVVEQAAVQQAGPERAGPERAGGERAGGERAGGERAVPARTGPEERQAPAPVAVGPVGAARPDGAAVAVPPGHSPAGSASAPRILVLGEVRVEGATGRAESTRVGRLAETAAFVLLNPDLRPSALQSALWPGVRSNPQTCRQMISRTRTWLGRNEAGQSYLMPFTETGGRLRLRPEVGSDWAQFQALAEQGLADPDDLDSLTAALRLVRGRPFGPVAGRELPWADLPINDMVCLITDVAHALACRHEQRGNVAAAREAALRGLLTESESEVLRGVLGRLAR